MTKSLATASLFLGLFAALEPAFAHDITQGIVIRRVAPTGTCSVKSIFTDYGDLDQHDRAHNLSVNCTPLTSDKNKYNQYLGGLLAGRYCVARVVDVIRKGGRVTQDATVGNALHCLINNIPAKDLSSTTTLY